MKQILILLTALIFLSCEIIETPQDNKGHLHYFAAAANETGIDVTGNYRNAIESFKIEPTGDVSINRVIISMSGEGIENSGHYGNMRTSLTAGIEICVVDSTNAIIENLTTYPIKTNGDWAAMCHDFTIHPGLSVGDTYATVRWTFGNSGQPVVVRGTEKQEIHIIVNDDFTRLSTHRFIFQGYHIEATQ